MTLPGHTSNKHKNTMLRTVSLAAAVACIHTHVADARIAADADTSWLPASASVVDGVVVDGHRSRRGPQKLPQKCKGSSSQVLYNEYWDVRQPSTNQQCNDWKQFLVNLGNRIDKGEKVSYVGFSGTYDTAGKTCTDSNTATSLVAKLTDGHTTSFTHNCNGEVWSVCNRYHGELWIGPPNLCSGANCPNPGYIIRPCISPGRNSNIGGVKTRTCGHPAQEMQVEVCFGPPPPPTAKPTTAAPSDSPTKNPTTAPTKVPTGWYQNHGIGDGLFNITDDVLKLEESLGDLTTRQEEDNDRLTAELKDTMDKLTTTMSNLNDVMSRLKAAEDLLATTNDLTTSMRQALKDFGNLQLETSDSAVSGAPASITGAGTDVSVTSTDGSFFVQTKDCDRIDVCQQSRYADELKYVLQNL